MPRVHITYLNENNDQIKVEEILTLSDHVYVFDDISNYVKLDDELSSIPKGTKEIVIRIPCDR